MNFINIKIMTVFLIGLLLGSSISLSVFGDIISIENANRGNLLYDHFDDENLSENWTVLFGSNTNDWTWEENDSNLTIYDIDPNDWHWHTNGDFATITLSQNCSLDNRFYSKMNFSWNSSGHQDHDRAMQIIRLILRSNDGSPIAFVEYYDKNPNSYGYKKAWITGTSSTITATSSENASVEIIRTNGTINIFWNDVLFLSKNCSTQISQVQILLGFYPFYSGTYYSHFGTEKVDLVVVNDCKPSAHFAYDPSKPTTIDLISFTDFSHDINGFITNWTWDFGDGNISYEQNPTHQYSTIGNYIVCLCVTDNEGEMDNVCIPIEVYNIDPVANFSYSPLVPIENQTISFTDASFDLDGNVDSWYWSFGDGNSSNQQHPTHSYPFSGRYQVTLTVTDDEGANDSITKLIPVGLDLMYIQDLSNGWNFVSLPFNNSLDKTDFLLKYDGFYYGLDDGIINAYMYGWDRIGQYYNFADTLEPGYGYWVFAYEDCELWLEILTPNTDDQITTLESGWNVIGLPFDQTINKDDVIVHYDDSDHTWSQAVSDAIVVNFVYGWDRAGQFYNFADMFNPGYSYWVYASQSCVLKRSI